MKKSILLVLFVVATATFLFAADNIIPQRPSNIPEDAEWFTNDWLYQGTVDQVRWHPNGNLSRLLYDTEDKKYRIDEGYYENGKICRKTQRINRHYRNENHKKAKGPFDSIDVGKQLLYHENGRIKEERCNTLVLQKNNTLENVMCGPEIFYDETGKEIKRIEHNTKCEYGCDDVPRKSSEQLVAIIKSQKAKIKNNNLLWHPVVGKIVDVGSWSKKIEIDYKTGFALNTGDQVFCLIDDEIVSFECKSNDKKIGLFELKEDKNKKYSLVTKDTEPRFYKKNEIKYGDYLKTGGKPKAGDVKVIAGIEFVYIPGGEFNLHDKDNSKKIFRREIKSFWMTKYEMTLGEFVKYCYEENKSLIILLYNKEDMNFDSRYPVALERYHDIAKEFCSWFGIKHGIDTTLPEADEWEYAARGGTATEYYWGNDKIVDYAWYKKNSGGKLHPVGEKKPNAYGLYDMVGNAWEWCSPFFIRGGGCRSDESDLQYTVNYMINGDLADSLGMPEPHKDKTSQGTSFRMIIRLAE